MTIVRKQKEDKIKLQDHALQDIHTATPHNCNDAGLHGGQSEGNVNTHY